MMTNKNSYSYHDLIREYKYLGIKKGDNIFATTGLGFLGKCEEALNIDSLCKIHLEALLEVIGEEGTLIVPTYSYTFGTSNPMSIATYDIKNTKSEIGPFPNFVLKDYRFTRSEDPMVSVSCIGSNCSNIISNIPKNSYGNDSVFERLLDFKTKCLSIGLGPNWTPFIHYLDYVISSEFRYDKLFYGKIKQNIDKVYETFWNYSVPVKIKNTNGDCHRLGYIAEKNGIWNSSIIGKGSIYTCSYKEYFEFSKEFIRHDSWCTTRGPKVDLYKAQEEKLKIKKNQLKISSDNNINLDNNNIKIINAITNNSLKKEYEIFSKVFSDIYIDYFEVRTGSNCGGYIVPEGWHPINLSIKDKNENLLFESSEESVIKNLVIPHSRSISNIPFENINHNYQNLSDYVIESSCKPNFSLNIFNFPKIKTQLSSLEELKISFQAEFTLSSMEVIVLIPNKTNNFKKISLVDSIIFDFSKNENLIYLIKKELIDENVVIFGPLHLALHSFLNIYELDANKLELKNLLKKDFYKYEINSGPNTSNNKHNFKHGRIKFGNF